MALRKLQQIVEEREREYAGILSPQRLREAVQRPLKEHLEEFVSSKSVMRDRKRLYDLKNRILKLIKECCVAPRFFVVTGQVQRRIISWELARGPISKKPEYSTLTKMVIVRISILCAIRFAHGFGTRMSPNVVQWS